jgi:hypothetical protein
MFGTAHGFGSLDIGQGGTGILVCRGFCQGSYTSISLEVLALPHNHTPQAHHSPRLVPSSVQLRGILQYTAILLFSPPTLIAATTPRLY